MTEQTLTPTQDTNSKAPHLPTSPKAKLTDNTNQSQGAELSQPFSSEEVEVPVTPEILASRYRITKKIGQGTQGDLYEAIRLSDGIKVAIKQLRIHSIQNWKEYDLFQRESHVLASLDMDGVAKFYESCEDLNPDHPAAYIVQEFIEGRSLAQMLKSSYRFTVTEFFDFTVSLIDLLSRLHHHDPPIIHRDIKPSNIILRPSHRSKRAFDPYLIDFGAVANPQVQGGGSTVAGTYGYMAPEQLMGRPEPASDIYALAAMLAYLLSGVSPDKMEINDFHLIIAPHLESIPRPVVCVLQGMLEPDPKNRFTDHALLKQTFSYFAAGCFDLSTLPIGIQALITAHNEISGREFNRKLQAVHRINQPGNMELWMRLPEATPRRVPLCYLPYRSKKFSYNYKDKSFKRNWFHKIMIGFPNVSCFRYIVALVLPMWFITHVILGCAIKTFDISISTELYIISLLFMMFIFPIILCITAQYHHRRERLAHKIDCNVSDLISLGRKAIATIVSVDYIPTLANSHFNLPMNSTITQQGYPKTISLGHPYFKVQYKFNPPDDSETNDLIHFIYLSEDVRGTLTPGQAIPILYMYPKYQDRAFVISMPFPVPLSYFSKNWHIVCATERGKYVSPEL